MLTEAEQIEKRVRNRENAGLTTATAERLMHVGVDGFEHTQATNVQVILAAPLDRLRKSGQITIREYDAGDRFRNDVELSRINPGPSSTDLDRIHGGATAMPPTMFSSQKVANARLRLRKIQERIPDRSSVWRLLWDGLIEERNLTWLGEHVFRAKERKEGIAAAKAGFKTALASLADVYEHLDRTTTS